VDGEDGAIARSAPDAVTTTTENRLPLSVRVVAGAMYFEVVAPAIWTAFLLHG